MNEQRWASTSDFQSLELDDEFDLAIRVSHLPADTPVIKMGATALSCTTQNCINSCWYTRPRPCDLCNHPEEEMLS